MVTCRAGDRGATGMYLARGRAEFGLFPPNRLLVRRERGERPMPRTRLAVWTGNEVTPEARRWSASQARAFLAFTKDDPLAPLFRIVLLRGARRGEAAGLRWAGADLDAGYVRVRRPIVLVRGAVTESTPKTKTGDRLIWLDAETVRILKEHRTAQLKARLMAGDQAARGTPLGRQPRA